MGKEYSVWQVAGLIFFLLILILASLLFRQWQVAALIFFFLMLFLAYLLSRRETTRRRRERAEGLKESGPQVPLFSSANGNLLSKFKDPTGVMRFAISYLQVGWLFRGGAHNLMEGNIGPIDFITFDYEFTGGGGFESFERTKTITGSAILLQSDQLRLPSFLWPEPSKYRERKVEPLEPPKAKEKEGFIQCPTCGSWEVRGGATVEHGGIGDWCDRCKKSLYKMNEEKVRKMFEVVSTADYPGWWTLASNTQLLLCREPMVAAEKMQEFMEEALTIFQRFQSASQNLNESA